MELDEREYLQQLCRYLTEAQLADAESGHDNLEVLLQRVVEDASIVEGHIPALEVHMHFLTIATIQTMQVAPYLGKHPATSLRNCLMQVFAFGYEVGKLQWPLKKYSCEEAHG